MNNRLTPELLWKLPRVGSPVPNQQGKRFIVPVTSYDIEANEGTTRLWLHDGERLRTFTSEATASAPTWSPDGKTIAFLRKAPEGGDRGANHNQVHTMPVDGGEPGKLTDMPLGVVDPRWMPDGKRIAFLSPLHKGRLTLEETTLEAEARKQAKVAVHASEDRIYRFWDHWICDAPFLHIFTVDIQTGEVTDLTPTLERFFPLMEPAGSWAVSPDGAEIAFTANRTEAPYHEMFTGIYRLDVKSREITHITDWPGSNASRPRFSPDGKWIVYGAQEEEGFYADKVRLVAHNRSSDKHVVLTEPWDRSAESWEFVDDSTVVLTADDRGANSIYTLDFTRAVESPGEVLPENLARGGWFGTLKCAGGKIFTTSQNIKRPSEVVTVSRDGAQTQHTEFSKPLLAEIDMGEVEEHYFKGAEAHEVQMWLAYPPGGERKNLPLVHLIHGGPHGSFGDQWHWRWCAQAFAAEGYLVAMVNFHGSTGWGNEFTRCIMTEWGKKPYEDIIAATDYLIEKGLADPNRTACAGGSYGGYMTSWIATQTDRFKCLVNHAGVSDLQAQYARDVTPNREKALGGEPWGNQEGMDRYNPIRHSKGFKTPMLILHGEKDYRVPYTQALETYNAYRAQNRDARLVVYEDENHWILKPQSSLHWYGEVFGWLKRWL